MVSVALTDLGWLIAMGRAAGANEGAAVAGRREGAPLGWAVNWCIDFHHHQEIRKVCWECPTDEGWKWNVMWTQSRKRNPIRLKRAEEERYQMGAASEESR